MKKAFKFLITLSLSFAIVLSVCSMVTFAAGTVLSFSKKTVSVGDSVNVTVTITAGEKMYGVGCVINYDSSILEYKSGNAVGSAGTLRIVESPSGETKVSYTLSFKSLKAGSVTVSVTDCNYSGITNDSGLSGASATLNVKDMTLSSNANLKSMYLSNGTLSPAFSASVTTYNVTVKNSVTECKISAAAADSAAKVEVTGSSKLNIGKNTRTVIVTAPNGTSKTYTLNITRSESDDEVPEEPPADDKPQDVSVDGVSYTVATDISTVKLFNGFSASQVDFADKQVAVAVDDAKEYVIYYLKPADTDTLIPYTYNANIETFEKLKYFTQGEMTYIFADIPSDMAIPEKYYTTNTKISDFDIKCYAESESNIGSFYYLYCYTNGKYGFYRYDSIEGVLQRYPELELIDTEPVKEVKPDSFSARFKTLATNAKIIVISLIFVALAVIALLIILILRFVTGRSYADEDNGFISEEDFENIIISDAGEDDDTVPVPAENEEE